MPAPLHSLFIHQRILPFIIQSQHFFIHYSSIRGFSHSLFNPSTSSFIIHLSEDSPIHYSIHPLVHSLFIYQRISHSLFNPSPCSFIIHLSENLPFIVQSIPMFIHYSSIRGFSHSLFNTSTSSFIIHLSEDSPIHYSIHPLVHSLFIYQRISHSLFNPSPCSIIIHLSEDLPFIIESQHFSIHLSLHVNNILCIYASIIYYHRLCVRISG